MSLFIGFLPAACTDAGRWLRSAPRGIAAPAAIFTYCYHINVSYTLVFDRATRRPSGLCQPGDAPGQVAQPLAAACQQNITIIYAQ